MSTMQSQPAVETDEHSDELDDDPAEPARHAWLRLCVAAVVGAVVVWVVGVLDGAASPLGGLTRYALRTAELVLVAVVAVAVVSAVRRRRRWDVELIVVAASVLMAGTVAAVLRGTPYGLAGLWEADQAFRMQAATRFADTWHSADYFYRGLHAYYAPLLPWVEGRAAALFGVPAWPLVKLAEIVGGFLAPLIAYLLWRRIVPARLAAFMAAATLTTSLVVYEPYALVVLAAIVPWWLEAMHGVRREGVRPLHPVVWGLIGAVLFTTYYYYLFVCVLVAAIYLPVERRFGHLTWSQVRRALVVFAVTVVASAPFWAPMLSDLVTSAQYRPLNNWYFLPDFADLALPMFEANPLGVLCLLGLVFLVWTAGEPLSRSLLVFLAAVYLWHAVGYLMIVLGSPLMSFKMRELVPLILVFAAVLALARLAELARARLDPARVGQLVAVVVSGLCLVMADRYVSAILDSPFPALAHNTVLPDGRMPRHHTDTPETDRRLPAAEDLRRAIDERYHGSGHPVVLSDRQDLFAFYPYYGFVEYQFAYSHPAARFRDRIALLESMQSMPFPEQFAGTVANNRYDRIDVIVLQRKEGGCLRFRFLDEHFPAGGKPRELCLPAAGIDDKHFDTVDVGDYVVAVLRP